MQFVTPNIETVISILNKLEENQKPLWGTMSAHRMVEHLSDAMRIALAQNKQKMMVPEEKLPGMLRFLDSDKEMMQNVKVPFANNQTPLRNAELALAIDELVDVFLEFEEYYAENPERTEIHPFYGPLNYAGWQKLNSKYLTHHFKQFGLL